MREVIKELISEEQVNQRIKELGEQITRDYEGKTVHLVCILKGACFFMCELAKRIEVPVSMDFMTVSSYGSGTKSSGVVRIKKDLDDPIDGLDVLIVEDIVDSGRTLHYLSEVFKELKARVVPLNVAGAFHSKLMQSAADRFYETAKGITFLKPNKKYYSNVTGGELTDFSDMPALLAKHIVSPVRFTSELAAMQAAGADIFLEFGPGKTLTGLVKKTLSGVAAQNVENLETLEKAAEIYG